MPSWRTLIALSTLALTPLFAHNGTIGRALPVADIALDARFDDWPNTAPVYPIQAASGGDTLTAGDFDGSFRLGYNVQENALYIAVQITDDSITKEPPAGVPPRWDTQDGCELYFDLHEPGDQRPPIQLWARGDSTGTVGQVDNAAFEVKIARHDNKLRYEWRVRLSGLGNGKTRLGPGRTLGFDLSFWDVDADGSASWIAWSPGEGKWNTAGQIGDMILLKSDRVLPELRGQVAWKVFRPGPLPKHVRLQSAANSRLWVQAAVDSLSGQYRAALPPGTYRVSTVDALDLRLLDRPPVEVDLKAEKTAFAPLLHAVPMPHPAELAGATGVLLQDRFRPEAVDAFVRASMEYFKIPGLSLAVVKEGQIVYRRAFGLQDASSNEQVKTTTLFEAASMTKPLFTYAVARLVERGLLDWDTPLYQYLPYEDIAHDERYKKITARMVVSHTTGFPNWRSGGQLEILFDPGTQFGYSGEGFEYLGKVVAHLTGKEIADLVRDEVLAPFGMDNAYLNWNEADGPPKAMAHTAGDIPLVRRQWDQPMMAASLHTDAGTYARFLIAAADHKGLSRTALDEMLTPQTAVPDTDPKAWFGLGFWLEKTPFGLSFGHGGRNSGFTCQSTYYHERKIGYVLMVNNDQAHALEQALRTFLVTGQAAAKKNS